MLKQSRPSLLKIPGNALYMPIVLGYIRNISALAGLDSEAQREVESAVECATLQMIKHDNNDSNTSDIEIQCTSSPVGLEITLHDSWIDFTDINRPDHPNYLPNEKWSFENETGERNLIDETEYRYLGAQGREIRLLKHFPFASVADEEGAQHEYTKTSFEPLKELPVEITYRPMQNGEAGAVARIFYHAYGFSYDHEEVYLPEKLTVKNNSGDVFSAVAITPTGEVVSHAALVFAKHLPGVAEIAMGATKPTYQGLSIAGKLRGLMIEEAFKRNLSGLFANTNTSYPFSQKLVHKIGGKESGFLLAHYSERTSTHGRAVSTGDRDSVVIFHFPMTALSPSRIHAPENHQDIIAMIYANLNVTVEFLKPSRLAARDKFTRFELMVNQRCRNAILNFANYGDDLAARLQEIMSCAEYEKVHVVEAFLNLHDPRTPEAYELMSEMGFFFSGIMPGILGGDRLILQYFNNFEFNYDRMKLYTSTAKDLWAYIRSHAPLQPQ